MSTTTNTGRSDRRRHERGRRLLGRAGVLRARLASWRANRRADAAQLELTIGKHRWLSADACISVIDGAALVQIDTSALDPARRCRVYVNDGPVYDAIPDDGDHDIDQLSDYLAELRREEAAHLTQAAAARNRTPDLHEWTYEDAEPTDLGRDWPLITLDQVVRWGGTALTEDEIERLVAAIPNSSIPDAIGEIVATITNDDQDQDAPPALPPDN